MSAENLFAIYLVFRYFRVPPALQAGPRAVHASPSHLGVSCHHSGFDHESQREFRFQLNCQRLHSCACVPATTSKFISHIQRPQLQLNPSNMLKLNHPTWTRAALYTELNT